MRMGHRFLFSPRKPVKTDQTQTARPLRIAMICAHSNPLGPLGRRDTGGMSVYIREMSRALASLGHMVDLFVGEPLDGSSFQKANDSTEALHRHLGPNVHWVSVPCPTKAPQDPAEQIKTATAFRRAVIMAAQYPFLGTKVSAAFAEPHGSCGDWAEAKERPFDIVFSHYWLSGLAGLATAKTLDVPHVMMFHTLARSKAEVLGRSVDGSCRLCAEHWLASQSHGVLAPTDAEKESLVAHYGVFPHRIAVVPCGVDGNLFRPQDRDSARRALGLPLDEVVFLFVGRLDPIKGLERLLEAFARLPRPVPARLLVVGGDASEKKSLETLHNFIRARGISQRVMFTGRVEQHRLPEFYGASDALVIASHYESFCLVALEALASGRPVVGPPVGVLPEVLSEPKAGVLLQDNSPEELLRGLTAIALEAQDGGGFSGAVCRQISRRYSWHRVARDLARTLTDLVNSKGIFKTLRKDIPNGSFLCSHRCSASGRS